MVFCVILKLVASLLQALRCSGKVANDRLGGKLSRLGTSNYEIHKLIENKLFRKDVWLFKES